MTERAEEYNCETRADRLMEIQQNYDDFMSDMQMLRDVFRERFYQLESMANILVE